MPVIINFKICDNAPECGGIAICPTGAMIYDEDKRGIIIDNDKCVNCGACESECPIGAIRVAQDAVELAKFQKEIDDDTRTIKDLFVDRYGAVPLSAFFTIENKDFKNKIISDELILIEVNKEETIACLLKSIPIKNITDNINKKVQFYKLIEPSDELINEYRIEKFPSLLVLKNGELLGKIDGYFELDKEEEFKNILNNLIGY